MYLATARFGASEFQETVVSEIGDLSRKERIVLQTGRGTEIGRVETPPSPLPQGSNFPHFARVLRRATPEDIEKQKELEFDKRIHAHRACQALIEQHKLKMRLVYVELLLGGEKAFFYFISDQRIDFRDLVKDLAREVHTRIELRQIGEREAARFLGDYQSCGQKLCCKTFLKKLPPVSMSMARNQLTTLDPGKLAGQCGKLKCCLRYEDPVYTELKKNLPERGTLVITDGAQGEVIGVDVYNQRLTLITPDGPRVTVGAAEIKETRLGGRPAGAARFDAPRKEGEASAAEQPPAQPGPGSKDQGPRERGSGEQPNQRPRDPRGPRPQGLGGPPRGPQQGGGRPQQAGGQLRPPQQGGGPRPQQQGGRPPQSGGPRGPARPPADQGSRRPPQGPPNASGSPPAPPAPPSVPPPTPPAPPAGGNPTLNRTALPEAGESGLLVRLLQLRSAPAPAMMAPQSAAQGGSCSTGGCGSGGCGSGGCSSGGCGTKKKPKPPPSLEDFYRLLAPAFSRG